ncbi:TPA: TIGR04197 family type VII secretion effector [Staphylococcus aureus]|nr:TIGR04197 family type VII secretion effector [Staphylococcus aureus]HDH9616932.1 TIGR04197 family type VII secretion effector [Staphylococcus aureus]
MGEIKVETSSTIGKIESISNAGSNVSFDNVSDSLEYTNISPFTGFAASSTLTTAISNYHSIITQDTEAMKTAVNDFRDKDADIAGQIDGNNNLGAGL